MDTSFSTMINRRRWLQSAASLAGLALFSGALSACGGKATSAEGNVTKLAVGCEGDLLAFDQTALSAPASAPIELTFANRSNHHQHNWLLVNGGDEIAAEVYASAVAAGIKNSWLPPAGPQIIAHTPLLDAGKNFVLTFQAPAQVGEYTYLCTFPGHFLAGMRGTLTIT